MVLVVLHFACAPFCLARLGVAIYTNTTTPSATYGHRGQRARVTNELVR